MLTYFFSAHFSLLPQLSIARMDPTSQVFCLRWNNHRNNLLAVFDHLLQVSIVVILCLQMYATTFGD